MRIEIKAAIVGAVIAGIFGIVAVFFQSPTKNVTIEKSEINNSNIKINQ